MASFLSPRLAIGLAILALGCRARGLPEPPPGEDPADPEAAIPAWTPPSDPLQQSAFGADEPAGEAMHEGHGHHHHHGADPQPAPDAAPDAAPPSRPVEDAPSSEDDPR